ncbi:MAG TPA: TonB-dependent receptor, partial [Devosia sp.]|nr:TonB-dependent receptor [Devosia sp.]
RGIALNSPAGTVDALADTPLSDVPEHSGSLFTTYTLPFGLTIGYGLTYQGRFWLSNRSSPVAYQADDYLIHNAFLSYDVAKGVNLQLNVKNFTDELYFTRIRNNGWATPGDGRSAILTANFSF